MVQTKLTLCPGGYKKYYLKWVNPPEIATWEVNREVTGTVMAIKRGDGVCFSIGDTVRLKAVSGRSRLAKLYKIQTSTRNPNFLQLFAYPLKTNGTYVIRNEKIWLGNARDVTNFILLENATK